LRDAGRAALEFPVLRARFLFSARATMIDTVQTMAKVGSF